MTPRFVVRVPGSSANLGPGFDTLGMALTLYAEVGTGPPPDGAHVADADHPATVAARELGGTAPLWVRSQLPMGRGLGYSGAVRVGGAVAATVERHGVAAHDVAAVAGDVLAVAARLEGHGDNVAASLLGGVTAATAERAVRVPVALDPVVLAWIPPTTTSTDHSRRALPPTVDRADASFNIARASMLVAALAGGDVMALREATRDRLHQQHRFAASPGSAAALDAGLQAGAWCGWLSGSGPTVAFLCDAATAPTVCGALPADGVVKALAIDREGAVVSAR